MPHYDRLNPFFSTIVSRYRLNAHSSSRETWHFVLRVPEAEIQYLPGDSVAIYPTNDPAHVFRILEMAKLQPEAVVKDAKGNEYSLQDYLLKKVNIAHVPKKCVVELVKSGAENSLRALLQDDATLKEYTKTHSLVEIIEENLEVQLEAQAFVSSLQPMLPRFYSIASSQSAAADEVHLTVARVHYMIEGRERRGICSHFLCDLAPLHTPCIPLYLQPARDFRLPVDDTRKIIMIGPGTGIAPFRAFMQERVQRKATGANWLFFGERHEKNDFFYQEYWNTLVSEGYLYLDVAFSRDTQDKIYVQDRMKAKAKEFWTWLQEGAILYVCGSADKMAKDVDRCLHEIVEQEGGMSPEVAREYVKCLRHEKRYLRDVY